tara:strand:+ start:420 stop:647 length:228 start_codon:yes stop_codon:yes gene_type:complete
VSKEQKTEDQVINVNHRSYKESELNDVQKILFNELLSIEGQIRELNTALNKLCRDKDYRINDFESQNQPEVNEDD